MNNSYSEGDVLYISDVSLKSAESGKADEASFDVYWSRIEISSLTSTSISPISTD